MLPETFPRSFPHTVGLEHVPEPSWVDGSESFAFKHELFVDTPYLALRAYAVGLLKLLPHGESTPVLRVNVCIVWKFHEVGFCMLVYRAWCGCEGV